MPVPPQKQIGLGMAALGRPGYINLGHGRDLDHDYSIEAMRQNAHDVLNVAWGAGVRYFDAARSYGMAESFLASWLDQRVNESDRPFVASKWGYAYTADWKVNVPDGQSHEVKDHSQKQLDRQYAESRQLLGDHLNLYQIHSATRATGVLENEPVLRRLAEIRDEGIRIGLSVSGVGQAETIRRALQVQVDGQPVFSAVQATWNLLETSAGTALAEADAAGWLVIIKEAVANGRLTDRNDDGSFADQKQRLAAAAASTGSTIDAVALAVALQQPWTHVVLGGAATIDQLQSNLRAFELHQTLPGSIAAELLDHLPEAAEDYWNTRSALPWN